MLSPHLKNFSHNRRQLACRMSFFLRSDGFKNKGKIKISTLGQVTVKEPLKSQSVPLEVPRSSFGLKTNGTEALLVRSPPCVYVLCWLSIVFAGKVIWGTESDELGEGKSWIKVEEAGRTPESLLAPQWRNALNWSKGQSPALNTEGHKLSTNPGFCWLNRNYGPLPGAA